MERAATRIVLAGGGTGGHVYPALAVARELRRRHPEMAVSFIGASGGLEQRLVPAAGFPLRTLAIGGLKGTRARARIRGVLAAGWAVFRCLGILLRERPQLAIGVGGYASGPAMLAAVLLRVRTMVLEQNHYPGATNRWLAPRVDAVCLPSEAAREHVRGRTHVTGNPVRADVVDVPPPPGATPRVVLVFGGSRGAHSINVAVADALDSLARVRPPVRLVVQTGEQDEAMLREACARHADLTCEIAPFLDDMPQRLAAADLVVCRAGAMTIAELCAAGRPAVLVPYPHAADDHQTRNARALEQAGAAVLLPDARLDGGSLALIVADLTADDERRDAMRSAALALAVPDASGRIVDIAERLLGHGPRGDA